MNADWLGVHLPEAERLIDGATIEGRPCAEWLEERLTASEARRGRPCQLSVRTLFVALQLGAFAGSFFLAGIPDLLRPLSPVTRARLGLARRGEPVTYRQVCYLATRVDEVLRESFAREGDSDEGKIEAGYADFDRIFSALASAGAHPQAQEIASISVDRSDVPTWGTSSIVRELVWEVDDEGQPRVARDAEGRAIYQRVRVVTDRDAGWRGSRNDAGKDPHFGYCLTAAVSTREEDGPLVPRAVVAARFRPTTVQDKAMGLACVGEVAQRLGRLGDVLIDRGYTASHDGQDFLLPIRALGGEPIFGLTQSQLGPAGTVRGAVIIEGRPYSPSIPLNLLQIEPPVGGEDGVYKPDPAKLRDYQEAIARRAVYALVPHGAPRANLAQVFQCPGAAGKLNCPLQPARKGLRPGSLLVMTAPRNPGEDSVCVKAYPTFNAEELPLLQRHIYGSREWYKSYSRRSTSVEPFFGNLKDEAGGGVVRGRIRVMGIVKTGLLVAFAVASTNRRLARAFDRAVAREKTSPRRRPGRPPQQRTLTYRRLVEDVVASHAQRIVLQT